MDHKRMKDFATAASAGTALLLAIFSAGCQTDACTARGRYEGPASRTAPRHVIVVGFDGLAGYAVTNSPAPTMRRMMNEGAWTLRSRSILPSSSALNWHSFFTCSASEQTGVVDWFARKPKFTPSELTERGRYPDVFSEFRRIRPEAEIGLFYEWGGIPHLLDTNACSMVSVASPEADDVARICDYITRRKPDFLAICLNDPDHVGHAKGWGSPEYKARVHTLDDALARVLEAIDRAGMTDETVVMLFSDHGGIGKKHGGPTLAEMERPSFLLGKGVKKGHEFDCSGAIYDDGATLAALLGIVDPPASWIGRPRHDAFR